MRPGKLTLPRVLPDFRAYIAQRGNEVGGSLHLVLDDGNVSDADVQWCQEWARQHGDGEGERLAEILLQMSPTQRARLAKRLWQRGPA